MLEVDRFVARRWHTPPRTESLHIRSLTFAYGTRTLFAAHFSPPTAPFFSFITRPASQPAQTQPPQPLASALSPLLYPLFIFIPTLLRATLTTSNTTTTHLPLPLSIPPPPSHLLSSCAGVTSASTCFCWVCLASALVPGPPLVLLLFFLIFLLPFPPGSHSAFLFPAVRTYFGASVVVVVGGSWCVSVSGSVWFLLAHALLPSFLPSFHPPSPLQPFLPFSSSVAARVSSILLSSPPPPFSILCLGNLLSCWLLSSSFLPSVVGLSSLSSFVSTFLLLLSLLARPGPVFANGTSPSWAWPSSGQRHSSSRSSSSTPSRPCRDGS